MALRKEPNVFCDGTKARSPLVFVGLDAATAGADEATATATARVTCATSNDSSNGLPARMVRSQGRRDAPSAYSPVK